MVFPDEPAYALTEINRLSPDSKNVRRIQTIRVIRQDWFADYETDLGLRENFTADVFSIPGGVITDGKKIEIFHSVNELLEMADMLRERPYDKSELPVSDLASMYQQEQDMRKDRSVNKWSQPVLS